ncbi:transcriptional repressor involved in the control of multidrug resistance [Cordyceps militaris CM01]|uniref:Transcriptional repressor involved in the control of multidrug resistance n=1 Tax=Cordyceps militaris (strain CM01) TaxID=983644 RepID=G3J644_CORMM|nr:transcriptional repressor involved in the control of multidrug resistance [Cordyceps militaris CM01]EGX96148.1 transcriptional repressor involved in the control of multidrug resistance [Cordyceps militaris CM01]
MPKRRQVNRPQPNAQHRQRVYAACRDCRRRRRKCDGSQPCGPCQAYGYACTYDAAETCPAQSSPAPPPPVRSRHPPETAQRRVTAAEPPLIVSRARGRLLNATSAVALPHIVGQALSMAPPPRLHSYAWNLGIRPEQRPEEDDASGGAAASASSLSDYLTLAECQTLCDVYFDAVHPLFAFFPSRGAFMRRLTQGWGAGGDDSRRQQPNWTAVVALVAALGSLFGPVSESHPREGDVKHLGLAILDRALSSPVAAVDMDAVAGWLLRALYTRLTTRPAVSCLASHTAMHLAEMMGLHRDVRGDDDDAAALNVAAWSDDEEQQRESRRRHICVARFLNLLLAAEYGLSSVSLRHARYVAPAPVPGAQIDVLHAMSAVLDAAEARDAAGLDSDDFAALFRSLEDMPRSDATVALFAADVCLCLLRRFTASARRPGPQAVVASAVAVLQRALDDDGIPALLAAGRTWWNMLSVPFQTVCVCVAADDAGMLALLPPAMALLRRIADTFGSHMAAEALDTARQVITAARGLSDAKLALKDAALAHALPAEDIDWASFDAGFDMGGDWPPVVDWFL